MCKNSQVHHSKINTKRALKSSSNATRELLIHGDVEAVSPALLMPTSEDVRLLTLLVAEMLLQTEA